MSDPAYQAVVIAMSSMGERRRAEHRDRLLLQGGHSNRAFVVLDGTVQLERVTLTGRSMLVDTVREQGLVCVSLHPGQAPSPVSAVCDGPVEFIECPMSSIRLALSEERGLAMALIDHLLAVTTRLMERLTLVSTPSASARVAAALLELAQPSHTPRHSYEVRATQDEIGRRVGLSREGVVVALRRFRAEGLVTTRRGRVLLLDEIGLRRHCLD